MCETKCDVSPISDFAFLAPDAAAPTASFVRGWLFAFPASKILARRLPVSLLALVFMLFLVPGSKSQSLPQSTDQRTKTKLLKHCRTPPDVTLFITPTRRYGQVSLAYRKRVPHAQVKKEIGNLASNGWVINNDIGVEDASIRPGDPDRAPVTTARTFP